MLGVGSRIFIILNCVIKEGTFKNRKNRSFVQKNKISRSAVGKNIFIFRKLLFFAVKTDNSKAVYNGKSLIFSLGSCTVGAGNPYCLGPGSQRTKRNILDFINRLKIRSRKIIPAMTSLICLQRNLRNRVFTFKRLNLFLTAEKSQRKNHKSHANKFSPNAHNLLLISACRSGRLRPFLPSLQKE